MRTLGLIGGTSWVSTHQYYRLLNELVASASPDQNAELAILSTNFAEFNRMDLEGRYQHHLRAARGLAYMGAQGLIICANSLHMFVERLSQDQPLTIVSLIDAVAEEVRSHGMNTAGILGTATTMTEPFYAGRLAELGVHTITPEEDEREEVNRTIFEELVKFRFLPQTRRYYLHLIKKLAERGAECVILGCTEIPLLLENEAAAVPLLDTVEIHCQAAVQFALA